MNILDLSYVQISLGLISALILFLYAIDNLSNELQELASEKFRDIISKLVKNRFSGMIMGALATAVTQSSSAVTVIAVLLVNTGIISFTNSLGIIIGSNVGTTITAQLALVNSATVASILIIMGFVLGVLGRKARLISKPIFFLGLILFALNLLSTSIAPLQESPEVMALFTHFSTPILGYFIGVLFTIVIHSSSITSGIVVILALGGIIPIEVAVPMILGANLGSSVTALIASARLNLYARRAGLANFMFNLFGTILFMLLLNPFVSLIEGLVSGVAQQTALAHLIFNVANTVIFLIILTPFEKLISWIVRGDEEEILFRTKYIQDIENKKLRQRMGDIKKELAYSVENTIKIYQRAISTFYNPSKVVIMEIKKLETLNDFLDDEITESILDLSDYKLSERDAEKTVALVKISNTIEQLGDLGHDFSQVFLRMHTLGIKSEDVNIEKLTDIHNRLIDLFREMEDLIQNPVEKTLMEFKNKEEEIYAQIREEFDNHVERLQEDKKYNGNIFVDAVSIIELSVSKVRDIRKLLLQFVRKYPNGESRQPKE
jgi:phosphate:Na+ symporter